jgi:hypothetical protein
VAFALLGAAGAAAQGGPGPGAGYGPGRCGGGPGRVERRYDPATVTSIRGEIVEVQRVEHRRGAGVHLVVASGGENLPVHLGPERYLEQQGVKLAKGDEVEVTGSRVDVSGQQAIVAQQVRRGDRVLALRDEAGLPLWRGMRR